MKRRDFVKIAALLPVAPAMIAASQFAEPKQALSASTDCPTFTVALSAKSSSDGWHTGFTYIDTERSRINGFWVTFDDIEKQTNFLRGHLGNKEDFWHIGDYYEDLNTVYGVETVCAGPNEPKEMTRVDFGFVHFYIGTGAKISINAANPSVRIEHISWEDTALNWKWTRETYRETVIRVATGFDAVYPEVLVTIARANKVPQTKIKRWMWEKKYGPDKLVLRSHFKADVTSGIGGAPS